MKIALLAAGLLAVPGAAGAELYRWVAGDGTVHYTADALSIPPGGRVRAERLAHPQPRTAPPTPAPAGPTAPWTAGAPILVPARLNGVPLALLLDTGADRTLLSPEAVARAGLRLDDGTPVQLTGVTGTVAAILMTLPDLEVAGVRFGSLPVVVHPMSWPGESGAAAPDGLLGRDLLEAFAVTVDPGSGRITLVPR